MCWHMEAESSGYKEALMLFMGADTAYKELAKVKQTSSIQKYATDHRVKVGSRFIKVAGAAILLKMSTSPTLEAACFICRFKATDSRAVSKVLNHGGKVDWRRFNAIYPGRFLRSSFHRPRHHAPVGIGIHRLPSANISNGMHKRYPFDRLLYVQQTKRVDFGTKAVSFPGVSST